MSGAFDGIRILEVGQGKALAYAGKLLRDLGAEVVKVEPPAGDALRRYGPFPGDAADPERSGLFVYLNGGKRGARLDLARSADRAAFEALVDGADVVMHSSPPSEARALGLDYERLAAERAELVVAAVTTYGSDGPYAEWRGYAIQAQAGAGVGIRTGHPDREPLNAPLDGVELHHGGVHAAVGVALALVDRDRTGRGQFVDASTIEALALAVEGVWLPRMVYEQQQPLLRGGTRFAGNSCSSIVETADGLFYFINLRDWHLERFVELLGHPDWSDDPRFASTAALRALSIEERNWLVDRYEEWSRGQTTAELWQRTQAAALPCQPVQSIGEVWGSEQLAERGYRVEAPGPHPPLRVPGAPYRLSATPWRPPGAPPRLDAEPATGWTSLPTAPLPDERRSGDQPLSGVRVLDLTQVLAGPMLGRYLADYGADVVIVETAGRPRHMPFGGDPSQPYAWEYFYRNRRSVTLDLKRPQAIELLKRLVGHADVVIDNFTPRVMQGLGLGYEVLRELNPRIIAASMSACGRSGPWSELATFGPSLSALYGMKSLNGYPAAGGEPARIMDDANELDPIAATYTMLAILAALHHRDRTGAGQFIELAQGEAGFAGLAEAVIELEWNGRELGPRGNVHRVLAPHGFYPTVGEDRWIAIACGSDDEWGALARAAGHEQWLADGRFATADARREARGALDAMLSEWTREHDAHALAERLQAAGVAAMPALDTLGVVADPHQGQRRRHFELAPEFPAGELLDGNPWHLSASPPRLRRPAPAIGAHNEEVFGALLGLDADELRRLVEAGVIA